MDPNINKREKRKLQKQLVKQRQQAKKKRKLAERAAAKQKRKQSKQNPAEEKVEHVTEQIHDSSPTGWRAEQGITVQLRDIAIIAYVLCD